MTPKDGIDEGLVERLFMVEQYIRSGNQCSLHADAVVEASDAILALTSANAAAIAELNRNADTIADLERRLGVAGDALPEIERAVRLANTLASDVPITGEARGCIKAAFVAIEETRAALSDTPKALGGE